MIKNERGFSLVEMMVGVAISSMITYSVFTVMRTSQEQIYATDVKMAIQENGREGLYKMTQELRLSASNRVTLAQDGQSIEFQVPDPSAATNSDYEPDWDNAQTVSYQFDAANKQLLRIENGDTDNPTVLMNDVLGVSFEGDEAQPNVVSVTVELERALGDGRNITENIDVTLNAELRNPAVVESEDETPAESDYDHTDDSSDSGSSDSGSSESSDSGSSDSGSSDSSDSGDSGSNGNGNGNNNRDGNGNGNGNSNGNGRWRW